MSPEELAKYRIKKGSEYPYDRAHEDDCGENATPPIDRAHAAARGILADLSDRRGIKWELEKVDDAIRREIVADLAAIIRAALDMPTPPAAKVKTLRDEFAMAALPSYVSLVMSIGSECNPARCAYEMADSMLAEREVAGG